MKQTLQPENATSSSSCPRRLGPRYFLECLETKLKGILQLRPCIEYLQNITLTEILTLHRKYGAHVNVDNHYKKFAPRALKTQSARRGRCSIMLRNANTDTTSEYGICLDVTAGMSRWQHAPYKWVARTYPQGVLK